MKKLLCKISLEQFKQYSSTILFNVIVFVVAKALEGQQAIKNNTSPIPKHMSLLSDLISENDEVVSAVLVCIGTSLILIMVTVSGNSLMVLA